MWQLQIILVLAFPVSTVTKNFICEEVYEYKYYCQIFDYKVANCYPYNTELCPPPIELHYPVYCPVYYCSEIVTNITGTSSDDFGAIGGAVVPKPAPAKTSPKKAITTKKPKPT